MPGGANVKLPEFWAKEPSLWFVTAEGPFESKGITAKSTKRAHVSAVLSVEVATRVKDELLSPHPTTPYTSLKNLLLAQFQRACSLLDMPPRPSEQPSALLDAMLAYLPVGVSRDSPDWLFRNLFLRNGRGGIRN